MWKYLILASLCSAFAHPAAAADDGQQPITIVPFEVLESHAACSGPGKTAVRVTFDVKNAKARFGFADRTGKRASCKIKTRRGGDVTAIAIPCPDTETPVATAEAPLVGLPRAADLAGEVDFCLGVTEITFVKGSWKLQAATSRGIVAEEGDLSSAGLTLIYDWPGTGRSATPIPGVRPRPPVLAIVWDRMKVTLPTDTGARLDVSTYLALAPAKVEDGYCTETGCRYWDRATGWIIKSRGGRDLADVVDYVDGP